MYIMIINFAAHTHPKLAAHTSVQCELFMNGIRISGLGSTACFIPSAVAERIGFPWAIIMPAASFIANLSSQELVCYFTSRTTARPSKQLFCFHTLASQAVYLARPWLHNNVFRILHSSNTLYTHDLTLTHTHTHTHTHIRGMRAKTDF